MFFFSLSGKVVMVTPLFFGSRQYWDLVNAGISFVMVPIEANARVLLGPSVYIVMDT